VTYSSGLVKHQFLNSSNHSGCQRHDDDDDDDDDDFVQSVTLQTVNKHADETQTSEESTHALYSETFLYRSQVIKLQYMQIINHEHCILI